MAPLRQADYPARLQIIPSGLERMKSLARAMSGGSLKLEEFPDPWNDALAIKAEA
jgi:hypothetical protein